MPSRSSQALARASRWLCALPISAEDTNLQILRTFGVALATSNSRARQSCGKKIPPFTWFHYSGDPLPAMLAHRALKSSGWTHPSLEALQNGYRSLASSFPEEQTLFLSALLAPDQETPGPAQLPLPALHELVTEGREEILELCRLITMTTALGAKQVEHGEAMSVLPALAFSYARDWDLEVCCALLRACAYLRLAAAPECRWSCEWLLDQQHSDGRFGLLRAEAERCGWNPDDWPPYFEKTIHAVWALSEIAMKDQPKTEPEA